MSVGKVLLAILHGCCSKRYDIINFLVNTAKEAAEDRRGVHVSLCNMQT
jgi:hypothetical protein